MSIGYDDPMSLMKDWAGALGRSAQSRIHREPAITPVTPSITADDLLKAFETSQAWFKQPKSFPNNPDFERRLHQQNGNLDFTNQGDVAAARQKLVEITLQEVSYLQETPGARLGDATHHGLRIEQSGVFTTLIAAYEMGLPAVEGSTNDNRHELAKLLADRTLQNIKETARDMLPKKAAGQSGDIAR